MAIAFDVATQGGFTSGTTHTFSHSCTGSDRILFVQSFHNNTTDTQTGVTYNGVAMTLVNKATPATGRYVYLWYLIAPATGSNSVVITSTASVALGGNASSYTGADQTTQPDASSVTTDALTTKVSSVTTVADNCWTVLAYIGNNANPTASTNSTLRAANATFADGDFFDNNGAITPAGSYSMTVTTTLANAGSRLMASITPAGGGGGGSDIKSIAGIAQADIKSMAGLIID